MKLKHLFLAASLMLLSAAGAMAQEMPSIPVDKDVKIGHLDNGLTYYIRHNSYPEHVASFYIAQKVGSINEDDNQRGLAHLLEHLAFNGSEHFKGNSLQEYLQSIGVEYGRNLNAYTSIDKTVYYFTDVPTTRITAVDSCMLILKDWSNGITLSQEAIDDERDVVHNEYRMRIVGQQRILERALPKLYPGSKYGERMPIGLMEIIDKCNPETLRAYYRKWYRPDNQAIIVVGDIDVNHIEEQIKKLFSGIKVPANAAKVVPEEVPDNTKAIFVVDKDKEQQVDIANIFMKTEAMPDSMKSSMEYLVKLYCDNVFATMMNARFSEMSQDPNCPFLSAACGMGDYLLSRTVQALSAMVLPKEGKMKEAYADVMRELKRARDFGFTATEYQRAQDEFMSQMEKTYSNRDKMKNEQFTTQYVDNFISNEPIPSVETEYMIYKMMVPNMPVEVINEYAKEAIGESDTNLVSLVMMCEKDGAVYPTEAELASIVKQVRGEKLEAYVDNVKQEPLMAEKPKAGKITATKENKQLGYKELTLSNGAKVILKKTDFKDNEIVFSASANVGFSGFDKNDYVLGTLGDKMMDANGLGSFSSNELEKALAGKQASVEFALSPFKHGLAGNSTPKDIETLMQLIHLKMTALSKDDKSVDNIKNTLAAIFANQSNTPAMVYQDSVQSTVYLGNKFARLPSAESIKALDNNRIVELAKALYGNAKDFTFYFVGNFDEATLLPLIEQYIASLPNKGFKMKNKEIPVALGEVKNNFEKAMENPQSQATEIWYAKTPYTLSNSVLAEISARLLEMDYLRNIREKLSAAYHAGANAEKEIGLDGKLAISLTGSAQLNPEKTDAAIPYFFSGIKSTATAPNSSDLQKAKEIMLKQAGVNAKDNTYWMGVLRTFNENGVDLYTDYVKTVSGVDGKAIADFLQNTILKSGNHTEVIMRAVKK